MWDAIINNAGTRKLGKTFTTKTGITIASFTLDAIIFITIVLKFIALFITARDAHVHKVHGEPLVERKGLDNLYYSMTILQ